MPLFGPPNVQKSRAKRDVKGLIKALHYPLEASVRAEAAQALGELKDPMALESLITALDDDSESVRMAATGGLGEFKDSRAVAALIAGLRDQWRHMQEKETVVESLVKISDDAVDLLTSEVQHHQGGIQGERIVETLAKIGTARTVEGLLLALRDPNRNTWVKAAHALGKMGDPRAVEPLIASLSHAPNPNPRASKDQEKERDSVASMLEVIGDEKAIGWLVNHANQYPRALQKVLERSSSKAAEDDLQKVAALPDAAEDWRRWEDHDVMDWSVDVDLSGIKQLAREELIRRGHPIP